MGLKNCMDGKTHRHYKQTKFCQNPRGDPKFLIDLTWNDHYATHFIADFFIVDIANEFMSISIFLCLQ